MAPSRFLRHRGGTIAVEFALLLPVMLVILFGSVEVTRLVRTSIRLNNVAQTIADLIAQQDRVTGASMANVCAGGQMVMTPFPTAPLGAAVVSVTNAGGVPGVDWQDVSCGAGAPIANAVTLAAPYAPAVRDSVIVVQASYLYTPILSTVLSGAFSMHRTAYARPRHGASVDHS